MQTETIECDLTGKKMLLAIDRILFRPTLTTFILAEHVSRERIRNRSALDLGCGVGPIAICLAMAGADHVDAVDLMPEACRLASENARRNHVDDRISFLSGDLFEPVRGRTYDMIVNDVSGVSEEAARLSSWFPPGVPSGGEDGTVQTVNMLVQSREYLKPDGFLLFPVLGLSRRSRVLEVAQDVYGEGLTRVASKRIPFNAELKSNMPRMEAMRRAGLIEFEQVRSRLFWTLEIYKGSTNGRVDDV